MFLMFGRKEGIFHKTDTFFIIGAQPVPTFRNSLPTVGKHQGFDLRRTPATASLIAVISCEEMLVCDTHFWHGRTLPCERQVNEEGKTIDDSGCAACLDKQSYRTHVYVSAFDPKSREHFIFECTANAAKPIEEYFQVTKTLRGCVICASRPKQGKNSKVCIQTNTMNPLKVQLPQAPDVVRALSVIWRLPQTALPVEEQAFRQPRIKPQREPLNRMRNQADNQSEPPTIGEILHEQHNGHKRAKALS